MKEYKITCLGCGKVRHVSYHEFKTHSAPQKAKWLFADLFTTLAVSTACIPMGCCCGAASLDGIVARNRTPDEQRDEYFRLTKVFKCSDCGSQAKTIDVVDHNLNELRY